MPLTRTLRSPIAAAAVAAGLSAALTLVLVTPGTSLAQRPTASDAQRSVAAPAAAQLKVKPHAVPVPPKHPTRANQIQNIDQVKAAIEAYYGDTVSGTNPDGTLRHVPSANGAYAKEVGRLVRRAEAYLARARSKRYAHRKAIVLDVDDTSLNTYNYEIDSNFVYNPAKNSVFVTKAAFPAVFGMPALAKYATTHGYTLFFLTGRAEAQRTATRRNLAKAGFPATPNSHVFLKSQTKTWLSSCAPSCTTVQYKSLTRRHIQSLGYTVVANFGDQRSDLEGGYAKKRFKLPNPMYFIP